MDEVIVIWMPKSSVETEDVEKVMKKATECILTYFIAALYSHIRALLLDGECALL